MTSTALSPNLPLVVVTRPAAQAGKLVTRLQAGGWAAWSLPTLEIHPLTESSAQARLSAALAQLADYDLVVLVSPNAIACALDGYAHAWPAQTALAVLGPGSVQALAERGITAAQTTIYSPQSAYLVDQAEPDAVRYDSETLWQVLQRAYGADWSGKKILLLRGSEGREWLADTLRAAGAIVDAVPCYQRRCPTLSDAQLAQLIAYQQLQQNRQKNAETAQPVFWLLTSSEGVRNLCEMVQAHATEHPDLFAWMLRQTALVPHPRIAEQARTLGFIDIRLSGSGDDNILTALRQLP